MNNEHGMLMTMNFTLWVEKEEIGCKSIRGIEEQEEQEYICEGGVNGYVHIRPKPPSSPRKIQVIRYLAEGYKDVFPPGRVLEEPLVLEVGGGAEGSGRVQFQFTGCVVAGRAFGEIQAEQGGILTETADISYQEMKVEYKK